LYFVLWQLLGCIGLGAWVAYNAADTAATNGYNPWWVGIFNGVSAFNNSGMSLLDANMVAFQESRYMLLTMGLMILAGNTCYPVFLRFIIWSGLQLLPDTPRWDEHRKTLRFVLDHPRRCYTTLFPAKHTWWLLAGIIFLDGIDWIAFEVLNIGNTNITSLSLGTRVLDGLFQALAVRSGGFYVVAISNLRIGLLILYVLMMYISVYPVVITMRNSNIYEERSLGIYADDPDSSEQATSPNDPEKGPGFFGNLRRHLTNRNESDRRGYFIRQQVRGQLSHDLWWICIAVLLIMIVETSSFEADPINYSVFNVIFEVVSAYGCVGISVGLPNVAYSFCGGWHVLSKLILCAVMIRGRHRGLPVAIDRAVMLPGEDLGGAEEQDARLRRERVTERNLVRATSMRSMSMRRVESRNNLSR
jgi:potassium uptake Trk family protein